MTIYNYKKIELSNDYFKLGINSGRIHIEDKKDYDCYRRLNLDDLIPQIEKLSDESKKYVNQFVMKYDTGKLDWSLLPWEVIETTVNRFTVGKDKYAKDSWKKLENGAERYESAMMRHFCEYKKGNTWDNDPKFKDHPSTHLQAMLWNAICLCWFELQKLNEDKSSNN